MGPFGLVAGWAGDVGRKERTTGVDDNLGRRVAEGERAQCWPWIRVSFLLLLDASASESDEDSASEELCDDEDEVVAWEMPWVGSSWPERIHESR